MVVLGLTTFFVHILFLSTMTFADAFFTQVYMTTRVVDLATDGLGYIREMIGVSLLALCLSHTGFWSKKAKYPKTVSPTLNQL